MKILTKLKNSQRGQAIVEFALVLPVLLILVLGSIDAGWLMYAKLSTAAAAREVVRGVSVFDQSEYNNLKSISQYSTGNKLVFDSPVEYATLKMTSVPENEIVEIIPVDYSKGAKVTVRVKTIVTPLVGFVISDPVMILTDVSMRLE